MKTNLTHLVSRAKSVSTRSLALMLCFVMLITAIGASTMMTAFAVKMAHADAAVTADESEDTAPSLRRANYDLAETGAKVDLAASGYSLEHGARVYFNSYARGSGAGSGNNVKKYVYMAILFKNSNNGNGDGGNYYQIVKMDHISNTELYTCYTSSANTNTATDSIGYLFFSSDASGWACKSSDYYGDARNNISANCGGFCSYKYYGDGNAGSLFNNHVYYCTINSSYGISVDDKDGSGNIANNASVTNLKSGNQKASVYVSSDGTTYTYAGNNAGDNTTKGGDVAVGGYGWSSGYETTAKGFAPSSKNNGNNSYSQYEKPVLTTWITMKVNEVYDGYHFMGWYSSSGTLLESSTTYYYQLSSNDAKDVHARFLKPEYTTATPMAANTLSNTIVINQGSNDTAPTNLHIWNVTNGSSWSSLKTLSTTDNSKIKYYAFTPDGNNVPNAIIMKGNTTTGNDSNKMTGNITSGTGSSNKVYYYDLSNTSATSWTTFAHLGATGLSNNKTSAAIGEEVTLTATAPATGTLKDDPKYYYYYSTNASAQNPTWYKIAESTSATQKFYPPANGVYTYKVAVQDNAGCETVVATASTTTTVGVVGGKYITGYGSLVGGADWAAAPDKGLMTETSSGSGIYTKTFGNVAAGNYQFRITTLNANGTVTWETDSDDGISGTASPTHAGSSNNNVQFVLTEKKQVTITYNDSTKAVTVDVADVQAIPVEIHAGTGGYVEVTYGSAITDVEEGEVLTVMVAYGDSIDLEATANAGSRFSKWYKNLNEDYKGTPEKAEGYDSLEGEVITKRTVYCAVFSGGGGSWIYSADRTTATPEVGGDASGKFILYNTGNTESDLGSNVHTTEATYQSGNDYWADLTGAITTSNTQVDLVLATGNSNNLIVGGKSTKINGTTYNANNGPTVTDAEGNTLFVARVKENNEVSASAYFIQIRSINWEKISALGVRAVYSGSGSVNYKFYYKLQGEASEEEYIPSTNFYAKNGVFTGVDEGAANLWFSGVNTTVAAVEDQVVITEDHEEFTSGGKTYNRQWVAGQAMKGSTITVTTTIPKTGTDVAYVDSSGVSGTCKPAQKYYVAGFSFNGVTPELLEWNAEGEYTCTYTIPADMKETMLEITPIYFVRDEYASNTVMIYLNGYNQEMRNAGWGNTLYIYPFYRYYKSGSSGDNTTYVGQAENFGRYPGQPVINYGGQLFMQIPLTDNAANGSDNDATIGNKIKGITINNGYNDYIHKDCCKHVSVHKQTYDYDDFSKIYSEKKLKNGEKYLHSIYFSFKYFPENTSHQHRLQATTNGITNKNTASRYNDLVNASGILSNTNGTVASATLISAGDNSTGWQYLTDALGNNVDIFGNKVTNSAAEPLRVFSLGYEYNNAGSYATEWAVYHLNGGNYELVYDNAWGIDSSSGHDNKGYNSSIVSSALVMNEAANLSNYTEVDGDKPINGYSGLYTKLKDYAGIPVMICYEHEIPDGSNPKSYRSDGRWTYTTVNDFVKSNIIIEYTDKNGVDHFYDPEHPTTSPDTFTDTHYGTVTGCSAYFTNSEYYGEVASSTETISNTAMYQFEAEAKGSYEFVGWYMYDTSGHESTITTKSESAETPKSGNFVLAARFRYVASGSLTISHSLAAGDIGRGTTYIGVTLVNGDKETVITNVNSNTAPVTIDKSYINSSSNYDIVVTLRTVPEGENTYSSYACYVTDENDARAAETRTYQASNPTFASQQPFYNSSANISTTTATYTINVKKDIYNSSTTQEIKAIEYLSDMTAVTYHYDVTYRFISRQYGEQAFTVSGNMSAGQINDATLVNKGTLNSTAGKALTTKFLQQIMPHESNFNEKIVWDFSNASNVTHGGVTKDAGTNTYTFPVTVGVLITNNNSSGTVTPENSPVKRTGYFVFPYSVDSDCVPDDYQNSEIGQAKLAIEPITVNVDTTYNSTFTKNSALITAPDQLYNTSTEVVTFFNYWSICTKASSLGDSKEVGRCYYPEFNYVALDNYVITPVYGETSVAATYADYVGTTIDFIGNTRNQWNNGNSGSAPRYAGDLVYNDFIISFKPEGETLINSIAGAQIGVVIEKVKEVETNSSGTNAKTLQEYAKDYTDEDIAAAIVNVRSVAGGATVTNFNNRSLTSNLSSVNNKNRYHYVLPLYNSYQQNSDSLVSTSSNSRYLYRAYSYMKIGNDIYVSEKPAYFCTYDISHE